MQPETEADLAEAIRGAEGPLRVVGGGTRSLPGPRQGATISTAAMAGIALYEPAALTLIARAGTPLSEIDDLLASEGQMLAFEPPAHPASTIGGVCAANASGPRRVQAGAARDAMIGVRFVDGSGAVIANGGRVMKNVTGYDLVKLAAGSRGRLGVLTEVALKVAPIPPVTVVLAFAVDAVAAVPILTAALGSPFDVSGAAWLPDRGALVRLEGLPRSVALRREALIARLAPLGPPPTEAETAPRARLHHVDMAGSPGVGGGPSAGPSSRPGAGLDRWRILCRPSQAQAILSDISPVLIDWGGAMILADLTGPPQLPPGAIATRLTGAPGQVPDPDPAVSRLEAALCARFDPRNLFGGVA